MPRLQCTSVRADGGVCRSPAQANGKCFTHDPEMAEAAAEARRKGGRNRRKSEATLAGFYGLDGLALSADRLRLLDIAMFETLQLPNSIPRSRTLVAIALAAERVQTGLALEDRVTALEATRRQPMPIPIDPQEDHRHDANHEPALPRRGVPFGPRRRSGLA